MSEEKNITEAEAPVAEMVEAAAESAVEATETATESAAEVVDEAKSTVEATVEAVAESVASAEAAVKETVTQVVAKAESAAEGAVEVVTETVEKAEAAAKETVTEVVAKAESAVEAVTEMVDKGEAAVEETVTETVTEVVAEAESAAAETVEAVAEAVEQTEAAVEETVTETVTEVVAEAESAAAETVEAVAEAVEQTEAAVEETATEVAAEAEAAAEKTVAAVAPKSEAKAKKAKQSGESRVVRTLSVGQQVTGRVKRTTEFGAFVDIGVGRDGLVHISELAVGRVQKVTDVLTEGQEVEVWIKKLDRSRNRISLTMISPDTVTIKDLAEGDVVEGTVTRIVPYGAFVDLGVGRDGLLHIREMSNGYVGKPEDVVKSGEQIEVRIIALNRKRGRIDLSLKGLRPEDEPEVTQETVAQQSASAAEEPVEVEEIEVLSPMELAFKKAAEAQGVDVDVSAKSKRSNKRSSRRQARANQDEIIARTLDAIKE